MGFQGAFGAVGGLLADAVQENAPRDNAALVLYQDFQDCVLGGGQMKLLPIYIRCMDVVGEPDIPKGEDVPVCRRLVGSELCRDARQQLLGGKGLVT